MKQTNAESLLKLGELAANCRLLNAVGHLTRGSCYAPMLSDVIKKFEMMNVNANIIV